jgi:hypothetical protein
MAKNKYKAIKTEVAGVTFDSRKEARRYSELKLLERAGQIRQLQCQPEFILVAGGQVICKYFGDFSYFENNKRVVEDVKSGPTKTPVYRLKRKLLLALNPGLDHREV